MKVDLVLISAALDSVFRENSVATYGAIPLEALKEHWESIHLRRSDLAVSIDALCHQGLIEVENRREGLWVRRKGKHTASPQVYGDALNQVDRFFMERMMGEVRMRQGDGYSGPNRRSGVRGISPVLGKAGAC